VNIIGFAIKVRKQEKKFESIDQYIATFPEGIQKILQKLRQTIKDAAPNAQEAISYQIPTFKLNGNLVHFAAYKNHIAFYPTSSAIKEFEKEISHYKTSKGTIQFPINEPLPFDLIERIVNFRVKENLETTSS